MTRKLKSMFNRMRGSHQPLDEYTSLAMREIYIRQGIEIGLFSYGCLDLPRLHSGVTVGRYCTFALTTQMFMRCNGANFIGLPSISATMRWAWWAAYDLSRALPWATLSAWAQCDHPTAGGFRPARRGVGSRHSFDAWFAPPMRSSTAIPQG